MKPLVSILIPAFNESEWIAETLESAIGQSWPRKEIIVVDDGSTDRTLAIARRFASASVSIVSQEHLGAAAARNHALSLSQGDYVQWLDADDLLAPDKIDKQMLEVDRGVSARTMLSSAWGRFMYRSYRAEFVPTTLWRDLSPVEWLLRKIRDGVFMQTATWLVSRELTHRVGPWDTSMYGDDDGEFFCRVLVASDGVRFVPDSRVFYRMSGLDRLSYIGQSTRKIEANWRSIQLHVGYLRSLEDSARVRAACVKYLQASLIHVYPERPDIVRQAMEMAADLGGELEVPTLSSKYSLIETSCGLAAAKRVQALVQPLRWSAARRVDKMRLQLDRLTGSRS